MLEKLNKFHKDDSGDILQTGIVMGILAIIAVGALVALGPKIKDLFNKTADKLDQAGKVKY